jgi:uncharacterized RDD family membrane protein YckC
VSDRWPVSGRNSVPLPPGLRVAGMGVRFGASLIDGLFLVAFQVVFWILAVGVGAVVINPEAQQQLQASPLALPSVAPYQANLPALGLMLAIFVILNVAYGTACWAFLRGLPGQRMMSLQVGDQATGRNLSLGRAAVRSVVALGIPIGGLSAAFFGAFAYIGSVPWPEIVKSQPGGPANAWLTQWAGPLDLSVLLALGWPVLLLIWTASSSTRQGLHDGLARSLVVGKARPISYRGYQAGFGPGFMGPAGGPTPGAWLPRGRAGDGSGEQGATHEGPAGAESPGFESPGSTAPPGGAPGVLPPGVLPPGVLPPGVPPPGSSWPNQSSPGYPTGPSIGPEGPASPGPEGRRGGWGWDQPNGAAGDAAAAAAVTLGRRLTAYMIDCVIVFAAFLVLGAIVQLAFLSPTATTLDERTSILIGLAGGAAQLAYFSVGWAVWRRTIGQRLMGLRVEDAVSGRPLAWLDAVVRWAVLQGPFALVTIVPSAVREPVLLAAPIWALVLLSSTQNDPHLRGLHDRLLNSKVVLDS